MVRPPWRPWQAKARLGRGTARFCVSLSTLLLMASVRLMLLARHWVDDRQHLLTAPQPCEDDAALQASCSSWSRAGECSKNAAFMRRHCKRSCGGCSEATAQEVPAVAAVLTPVGVVGGPPQQPQHRDPSIAVEGDLDTDCQYSDECTRWAQNGECQKNQLWMEEHCREACGLCMVDTAGPIVRDCKDTDTHCPLWGFQGECRVNKAFMHSTCPKSCRLCRSIDDLLPAEPSEWLAKREAEMYRHLATETEQSLLTVEHNLDEAAPPPEPGPFP